MESGTSEIADAGLTGVTIKGLIGGGSKLCLVGYSYAYGDELYAGSISGFASVANNTVAKNIERSRQLTAMVLGNPVVDKLNLSINTGKAQSAQVIITDASGKVWINKKEFLNPGNNKIAHAANKFTPGVYILKIIAEDGASAEFKIVK